MPNILLGSEVIIMSVEDARKLIQAILAESDRARLKRLEKLGFLNLLEELRSAVRRYDYNVEGRQEDA